MDAGNGRRSQRARSEKDGRLHDGNEQCVVMMDCTWSVQVEWMMDGYDGRAAVVAWEAGASC